MSILPVLNTCYSKEKTNNATAFWFLTSAFTLFHLSKFYVPWHLKFSDSATFTSLIQKSFLLYSTLLCSPVSPGLADILYPSFSSCDSLSSLALFIVDIQALAAKFPAHFEITGTEISFNSHSMQTKSEKIYWKWSTEREKGNPTTNREGGPE